MENIKFLTAVYAAAGVTPSSDELNRWAARYPSARSAADAMYAIPEAMYEDVATVFKPTI